MIRILMTCFSVFGLCFLSNGQVLKEQIEAQNNAMEDAFAAGDMKKLAWYYLDDAVLLSPASEPVTGREEIDAYWARISNPVSWDLEVIEVSSELEDIYKNEYYQALDVKPPPWEIEGITIEADDRAVVYQLGRSTLVTKREGKEQKSVVTFILVWKYTPDGYRILVDTYSW